LPSTHSHSRASRSKEQSWAVWSPTTLPIINHYANCIKKTLAHCIVIVRDRHNWRGNLHIVYKLMFAFLALLNKYFAPISLSGCLWGERLRKILPCAMLSTVSWYSAWRHWISAIMFRTQQYGLPQIQVQQSAAILRQSPPCFLRHYLCTHTHPCAHIRVSIGNETNSQRLGT